MSFDKLREERALNTPEMIEAYKRITGETSTTVSGVGIPPPEGIKDDAGNLRWDLLPPSMQHVVEVYTIGAKKYGDYNWHKGMAWHRIFRAMVGHAWKWWWGEKYDPTDGQHHLASVAWGALTLMQYQDDQLGTDDRVLMPLKEETKCDPRDAGPPYKAEEVWGETADSPIPSRYFGGG